MTGVQKITDVSIKKITRKRKGGVDVPLASLTDLGLSGCKELTDTSIMRIVRRYNTTPRSLRNNTTRLTPLCFRWPYLRRLDVSCLPKITNKSCYAILKYCKNLRFLNVDFSEQVRLATASQKARRIYGQRQSFMDVRIDAGDIFEEEAEGGKTASATTVTTTTTTMESQVGGDKNQSPGVGRTTSRKEEREKKRKGETKEEKKKGRSWWIGNSKSDLKG